MANANYRKPTVRFGSIWFRHEPVPVPTVLVPNPVPPVPVRVSPPMPKPAAPSGGVKYIPVCTGTNAPHEEHVDF